MANIGHKTLVDAQRHENKGVSTATSGQVATADGAGNTVWTKLTAANLQTTANPFGAQLFHAVEVVSPGAGSGTGVGNNAWNACVLNTVRTNEITSASLGGSIINLPAGSYYCEARGFPYQHNEGTGSTSSIIGQTRLRNVSSSATVLVGQSTGNVGTCGIIETGLKGRFSLAGSTNLQLQTFFYNPSGNYGAATVPSTGEANVWCEIMIWKVA